MAFNQTPGETFCISGKTVGIDRLRRDRADRRGALRGFGCTILYNKRSRLPAAEEADAGRRICDD